MTSQIDKIAEAMNAELTAVAGSEHVVPVGAPEVVMRTFARMGWRAHKYPAPDRPGVVGPEDPQWSLDLGTLHLDLDGGVHLHLDGGSLTGNTPDGLDYAETLNEYQQLAEGILAAVELARELIPTDPENED